MATATSRCPNRRLERDDFPSRCSELLQDAPEPGLLIASSILQAMGFRFRYPVKNQEPMTIWSDIDKPFAASRARLASSGVLLERLLHDLKQPLSLIRVIAQDVKLDIRKGRLQLEALPESMTEIERSVDELAALIDRLRIFIGHTAADAPFGGTVLNDVCRAVAARIAKANPDIEISESLAPGLPIVASDPCSLEQVLWEILDNAAHATRAAGRDRPRIEVSTFGRGRDVGATVRDNGLGGPDGERSRIFEPFHSTRPDAAGMGLALARALVAGTNGTIALLSSDPNGSTFEVSLPGVT